MTPLRRLVLLVALLGTGAQLGAATLLGDAASVVTPGGWVAALPPVALVLGLLLLTAVGDTLCVPVRRGEEVVETLTLYEAAVVLAVLLLPARDALWVPVAAVALTSLLERRGCVKSLFNLGNHAAATAMLVVLVHLVSGPGRGLDGRTVLALLVGLLAFSAVNLVMLAAVLAAAGEQDPGQVLVDGARLALVGAVATVAMAGGGVVAAVSAPALLPFSLVPAAALLFAVRATASAVEQRMRSARLLALSRVLAGRAGPDALLPAFLSQCRQAFGADVALVLLAPALAPGSEGGLTARDGRGSGSTCRPTTDAERRLLSRAAPSGGVLTGPLPDGWLQAVTAPLEADGAPLGTLLLATRDRTRPLARAELALLVPLASALAVALRGALHLQQLSEATSSLQAVVDQSSDGILVLDGGGAVQLWSPALERLTAVPAAAAVGRRLAEVLTARAPDGTPAQPFEQAAALLSPASAQADVELILLREDGEQRVVRCAHAAAFDETGRLLRDVVIVHDVTRERQVERLKSDFIATVSHELRSPVTPIKGYADLLLRRGETMTAQRRDECLAVIADRSQHLARLVEDLLLASHISATRGSSPVRVAMARDDLVPLVRRAAADFDAARERLHLALPDHAVEVACDPVRVVQVLTNLVGNALKYSPATAEVVVALGVEAGRAVVTVTDRGRGIPADQLERVFDKFHRVEDPLRMTTGGTGLGLYIARSLATAMRGSLTCTSVLGSGSTFRFELDLADPAAPAPRTAGDSAPAAAGPLPELRPAGAARGGGDRRPF